MAKTIVCFGDSNTHGTIPSLDPVPVRFPPDTRWPAVMAAAMGPDWHLVEEGLPGRTTRYPDPIMGAHMDGRAGMKMALMTHAPIDAMTIMLGTNDVKTRLGATPEMIAAGLSSLLDITRDPEMIARAGEPRILVIAPPPVAVAGWRAPEWVGATAKSQALPALYAELAHAYGAAFLDAGGHVEVAPEDGIHWSAEAHRNFGRVVARTIAEMMAA